MKRGHAVENTRRDPSMCIRRNMYVLRVTTLMRKRAHACVPPCIVTRMVLGSHCWGGRAMVPGRVFSWEGGGCGVGGWWRWGGLEVGGEGVVEGVGGRNRVGHRHCVGCAACKIHLSSSDDQILGVFDSCPFFNSPERGQWALNEEVTTCASECRERAHFRVAIGGAPLALLMYISTSLLADK
ncbi:MAG: hypothetical protein GY820_21445 [Gammaproteobacteria bacterium]|nr:hypothetical protein [Gammaproteobacteria bacterium]